MQTVTSVPSVVNITGEVIATGVSYEQFLADYDSQHVEWIDGLVIQMPSVTQDHNRLTGFLISLFRTYVDFAGGGEVFHDPMIMRLVNQPRGRAPDVQVLLPENLYRVRKNDIYGPADLAVEVVSPGTQHQDRAEKLLEYERGGVREYWVLDRSRRDALFYVLGEEGAYELRSADENGMYQSTVLDRLRIEVDMFWRDPLPNSIELFRMIESLFAQNN